ncbi:MAG: hypothetical protein ABR607_08970 [Pyrinomonadaceae bacterium]
MIICPSCGSGVNSDLCLGCPSCGARAVGPPLAKAEHQLPSFGRGAAVFIAGLAMFGAFTGLLIAVLLENKSAPGFWAVVTAGEIAAWRVKWEVLFASIVALWGGARIIRSISHNPSRFIGLLPARIGFSGALAVTMLVAALIGITVPDRLRQRQMTHNAALYSQAYTYSRALLTYRELHGFIPSQDELIPELKTLPDPDGSIAAALQNLDMTGYQPGTVVASTGNKGKPLPLRGEVIRKATTSLPVTDHGGISFTNYDLRLPGEDKILNNDDDLIVSDGLVMTLAEYQAYVKSRGHRP